MPFSFKPLSIRDVILVEPKLFYDDRGFFMESYKQSDFTANGIEASFVQDNHSLSVAKVIRGLHYQRNPKAQGKLVRVVSGRVWDVAVDVRRASTTFGRWVAHELSDENNAMLYIPAGFAHGFAALTDNVHLVYKCTTEFDAAADAGIRWDDPDIAIQWPINDPVISMKDRNLPFLRDAVVF